MRFALVVVAVTAGCFPVLSPPAHVKAGGAYSTTETQYEDFKTDNPAYFSAGVDTANVTELPVTVGAGATLSFNNTATYVELGWIRRVVPWLRVGANAAGEYWIEEAGYGTRAGITLELTSKLKRKLGTEVEDGTDGTHDRTTTYMAASGSLAIGGYIDVGHRWMRDEPNHSYVCIGLSFRLPAVAAIVDISDHH